jgi:hypothetical protein
MPLDSSALAGVELAGFSAIILDLRAYEYRPDARRYNGRLLDYVKDGGNLIVFYHKADDWNGRNLSPFKLTLTTERVTEENAPITILRPDHFQHERLG